MSGEETCVATGGAKVFAPSAQLSLSVAMATYNGERYLVEQLESLLRQTRQPDELIVSDDGSTDRTCELVQSFAAKAPFPVRLLANSRNLGVNGNFDRAIAACRGGIVFPCDHDDVWLPQKIERMADVLERHPTAAMLISNSEIVDQELRSTGRGLYTLRFPQTEKLHRRGVETVRFLLTSWAVAGHTMAFRRVPALAMPASRIAVDCTYDFVRALVAGATHDIATIPDRLTKYRRHQAQVTNLWSLPPTPLERLRRKMRNIFASEKNALSESKKFARDLLQVCEGLRELGADHDVTDFLRQRADMVLFQANLRLRPRVQRVPGIVLGLLGGRYHKYAGGVLTALQDACLSPVSGPAR
ncbi:MAG TPA: glycosyltransferase [Acetobacteraceae bacterium]|nr:glycosyltransferase [Acetobacteraceae bacterium]